MAYDQDLDNYNNAISYAKCNVRVWQSFEKDMKETLWPVDGLLLVSAIMAGVIVGIGAYGQRYRHHPVTHFIFLGATTLFLPIISSVVSSSTGFNFFIGSRDIDDFIMSAPTLLSWCNPNRHSVLVVTWALLVQNVMINTSVVVAVDDREGASVGPPLQLLAQGAWTFYLGINFLRSIKRYYFPFYYYLLEVLPFLLTLAKLVFKYYAVRKAHKSFSFGRNPRLVSGYMQQLPLTVIGEHAPPPLLVMGEETRHVEKQHHGCVFKDDSARKVLHNDIGLVTIDSIWQFLSDSRNSSLLPAPTLPQSLKDLCLSFSLFKLLRCRFARYKTAYTGSAENTFNCFWGMLLKDGEPDPDRLFGVIADELSFVHDYYYSSLPISYSKCWLPVVGIIISILSISYCFFVPLCIMIRIHASDVVIKTSGHSLPSWMLSQIHCTIRCKDGTDAHWVEFGSMLFDLVPLFSLLVFVVIAEVRDIVSYICSNWTKVLLTCHLLINTEQSLSMRKCCVRLLQLRCKLTMKQWDEEMGQCSVLPLRSRTTLIALVRRLLHLPDHTTKLTTALKISIIDTLQSSKNNGALHLSNGKASLCRSGQQVGERFIWACNRKSVSDVILTWQIATSILEVRYPRPNKQQGSSSITSEGHRMVATHLSRYCVYLVACYPELLPDYAEWSKILYDAVEKDVKSALANHYLSRSSAPASRYQELVDLLSANATSKHQVLNDGVKLGKQLVETINGEAAAWKLLADFWSEMILYVAPSDNLKGHKEAISRGGELITLLWALLNHVGLVKRTTIDATGA